MPDLRELYDAATAPVRPEPGALERQHRVQRRRSVQRRTGGYVVSIALVALAVVVVLRLGRDTGTPSDQRTPTAPVTAPTPTPVSTEGWVPFQSDLYGYTMAHPADWEVRPASEPWRPGAEFVERTEMSDLFVGADGQSRIYVASMPVPTGTSPAQWLAQAELDHRAVEEEVCGEYLGFEPVTVDGVDARISVPDCEGDVLVLLVTEGRVYVFLYYTSLSSAQLPLFDVLLQTIELRPELAVEPT
jgi:hypothetical protein